MQGVLEMVRVAAIELELFVARGDWHDDEAISVRVVHCWYGKVTRAQTANDPKLSDRGAVRASIGALEFIASCQI